MQAVTGWQGAALRAAVLGLALAMVLTGTAAGEPEDSEPLRFDRLSDDPVLHGERLSAVLGCIGCHALDLTGSDWSEPDYGVLWTANLTRSAERYSDIELTAMIVEGRGPDRPLMDMPSILFNALHPDDVAALVAYLKSLEPIGDVHPEPTIGPQLARDIEAGEYRDSVQTITEFGAAWPPDAGPGHAFGRHIVRATCVECHGMGLAGDSAENAGAPSGPDLRVVAAYPEADFYAFLQTGKALGGRELPMMSGVARWRYARFSEGEARAVRAYLVALAGPGDANPPPP